MRGSRGATADGSYDPGISTVNVLPFPRLLFRRIEPPSKRTSSREI